MFGRLTRPLLAVVTALLIALPVEAGQGEPRDVIEHFNVKLLEIMKEADELGFDGRYAEFDAVLGEVYDLPFMARVSVGRHWKELGEDERRRLVDAFTRMTVATYANRFNGFSGERFEIVSVETKPRGSVLVSSQVVKSDGSTVALNYLLRQRDGGWRVVDVHLEGAISELATRRAEYSSVITRQGFDRLVAVIDAKTSALSGEPSTN